MNVIGGNAYPSHQLPRRIDYPQEPIVIIYTSMPESSLQSYLSAESTIVEFKELLNFQKNEKSWLKTISAFANTKGGTVVVGIADDKTPIGVSDIKTVSAKTAETINARIEPIPNYDLRTIHEENKDFLLIVVAAGPTTPYFYNANGTRTAYVRKGDQSKEAAPHDLTKLILKGMNTTYDALESPYPLSRVSFTFLSAEFQRIQHIPPLTEKDLISFGLLLENGNLTNGGVLLCDQYLLRHSRIFCTCWKYLEKGHLGQDAVDDKEYEGNILQILNNAEMFIVNNSKKSWGVYDMRTVKHEDYPREAIHEALVNAIIHRDYFEIGSEIHVDMYPDRVEIISPGGMFDGSFIQDQNPLTVASKRRNQIISDIFSRLDMMDRRGSGFKRIIEAYENEAVKPSFHSDELYFRVTLPNTSYHNDDVEQTPSSSASKHLDLSDREKAVLQQIAANPTISIATIALNLDLTQKQARLVIDSLKENQILIRDGSNKTGKWKIL